MAGAEPQPELPTLPPNWQGMEVLEKHPELHHYTTAGGLRGIVSSNTLWATHFGDLNDASELTFIRKPLEQELARNFRDDLKIRRAKSMKIDRVLSKLGGVNKISEENARHLVGLLYASTFSETEKYEGVSDLRAPAFITSFCTHSTQPYERDNGLLSQWRGYGGAGGYCIVFDTMKMFSLLDHEVRARAYMSMAIDQATYLYPGTKIVDAFPKLIRICNLMMNHLIDKQSEEPEDVFSDFIMSATFCKHHAFHEEREMRIAVRPATDGWRETIGKAGRFKVPPPKIIEGADGTKRRVTLFDDLSTALPIKRVIVGPSSDQDENERAARELLGPGIEVCLSSTPYVERNWGR